MTKILLLTDFSPASQYAISFAQSLFPHTDPDYCLLHVRPRWPDPGQRSQQGLDRGLASSRRSLRQLRAVLASYDSAPDPIRYRTRSESGEPASVVNELLAGEAVDLVVVGATGTGNSPWLGSVATALIRQCRADVLVVPQAPLMRPVRQVVLAACTSLAEQTLQSIHRLNTLLDPSASQLTVLAFEPVSPSDRSAETAAQRTIGRSGQRTHTIHDNNTLRGIDAYLNAHSVDLLAIPPHAETLLDVVGINCPTSSVRFRPRVPMLFLRDEQENQPRRPKSRSKPSTRAYSIPTNPNPENSYAPMLVRNASTCPYLARRTGTGPAGSEHLRPTA